MNSATEDSTRSEVKVSEGPLTDFRVSYHDVGEGTPVVFLHGSGPGASAWSNFRRNISEVAAAGFRIILIDFPGWNESDPIVVREGSRAAVNAAAIKGVLDHLGIERAHLVGNSMGGAAALYFALEHPGRVLKIACMGAGAGGPSALAPAPTEGIRLLMGLYREPTMESLSRMLQSFVFDASSLTPELIQSRLENIERSAAHLKNFLESMRVNSNALIVDLSARLAEISAPVLIVWGRDDRFVPLDSGLRLLASLSDARMHIFNKCGHWAQFEKSDEFNALLTAFLKS